MRRRLNVELKAEEAKLPSNDMANFGDSAKSLGRNPLGIIALFLVLVYGFACLVTGFARSFTPQQETPLIWFLVLFPVLVLGVFAWLVSKHSGKLFAPADFKNEDNYVKMQMSAAASLTLASTKSGDADSAMTVDRVVELVQQVRPRHDLTSEASRRRVLWVDDNPDNNIYERDAFESIGINFTLAKSTDEALKDYREPAVRGGYFRYGASRRAARGLCVA